MRIGIMDTALGAASPEEAFELAAKVGAGGVELTYATNSQARLLARKSHPAELAGLARSSGLELTSICLGMLNKRASLIGTDEQIEAAKKIVTDAIAVAAEVGVKVILLPFFGKNVIEIEAELQRAADSLLDLSEPAEQAGVVLGVESTLNFDQQEFLLNHVGQIESVKMYVDTANALARKVDFATGVRDLGPAGIAQVHLKDVKLTEGQPPDYDVDLGEGDVDFQAAARALQAIGYDGWVIVETPPGDDPVASAKKNLAFAAEAMAPE